MAQGLPGPPTGGLASISPGDGSVQPGELLRKQARYGERQFRRGSLAARMELDPGLICHHGLVALSWHHIPIVASVHVRLVAPAGHGGKQHIFGGD